MRNIEKQVGQLAESLTRLEQRVSTSLPSQTVVNPKENVSAINLRSGRSVENKIEAQKEEVLARGKLRERSEVAVENSGSGETGLARSGTPGTSTPRTTHPRPDEEYEDRGDFAFM